MFYNTTETQNRRSSDDTGAEMGLKWDQKGTTKVPQRYHFLPPTAHHQEL
jgi:hypothetical protein